MSINSSTNRRYRRTIASILLLSVVPSLLTHTSVAVARQDSEIGIQELENKRIKYLTNNDLSQLDELLSNDLTYTHSTGQVETKTQFLATLRANRVRYSDLKHSEVRVRMYEDAAVMTGRSQLKLSAKGQKISLPIRFTLVYAKEGGKWKMVAWQSTQIPKQ